MASSPQKVLLILSALLLAFLVLSTNADALPDNTIPILKEEETKEAKSVAEKEINNVGQARKMLIGVQAQVSIDSTATPDQPVDDEAVYLNVAGECPKGRVYGLGSLRRNKRRYADPGASTSQMPKMVPCAEFDIVANQLRKVMAFMHQQFRMTMDGAGLSQPQPPPPPLPPPPPPNHQQPPQIDSADPPQQGDNVEREAQECYIRLSEYEGVCPLCRGDVCEAMSKLQELALSLAHKCLSFDFVGTSLDESSEEFGTVSLEASSGGSFKPANLFLLLCNRIFTYVKGAFKVYGQGLADHDNYHDLTGVKELLGSMDLMGSEIFNWSEGAVGVNGSHGFRNLVGIVQFGTWAYRGPCFNELREITSLDASSYGYSHIGSLRKMFHRSFTVDVSGLDKTSTIKHLRERTSALIKEVKSALVNCNWYIVLGATQCRGCTKRPEEKRCGVSLKKSSRTVVEGLRALVKNDKEKRCGAEAMFADLGHFFVRSIQVGITTDVQCTTDMLTSTRGLSSKDNKGTSSSLEADSCIMVAELELEMQESKGSAS
ncbi:hypothetical protein Syun_018705 [Stephania yunnanensis]|uniref:Uncharacterized protein n=1 Tax=Stephania yunnanensis TaxID=152371 RepID=A0AAP0NW27_9MAGN